MIGVVSRGILGISSLESLLAEEVVALRYYGSLPPLPRAIAGWGRKPSADKAIRAAKVLDLPYVTLEDGFLRSVNPGLVDAPLSIVVDDVGIYYDATRPSRLELLIPQANAIQKARAHSLVGCWREANVSKYNHLRDYQGELPKRYVLVADQTFGDAAIQYGMAAPVSFARMLEAALSENPCCTVLVKIHPDVFAGKKRGNFDVEALSRIPGVKVLSEDVHPVGLIQRAEAVYVVTSQIGFEGLLWGKRVRTFGMPFYAGWGLTEDELPAPARRKPVHLENLVYAALVEYPRYIHPETGERCQVEQLIQWMAFQRLMRQRFPAEVCALNFSPWKKPKIQRFFQGSALRFVTTPWNVPTGATLAVWGRGPRDGIPEGVAPLHLEDGFLRSVGLGADLAMPLSWIIDRCRIYYDATRPSDLEQLLQTYEFGEEMRARAARLREAIVAHGLTKYNVGAGEWVRPELVTGWTPAGGGEPVTGEWRRVILVPGQVENDASIRYGAADVRTNLGLLQAVRKANPDAYVVYKPHPDVIAGLRKAGVGEDEAARWCDEIVEDVPMQVMLDAVDEVHVITSLAGFEALLRGRKVTCYGNPFYAGWGLTQDMAPLARRTRRLSLDELVAGVLILYPTYVSRTTGRFTTPERALEELLAWREQGGSEMPFWRKGLRVILRALKLNG